MKTIKVKELTAENFKHYGSFASMVNPEGPSLGDFYNDQVEFPVSGNLPIAFSPLVSRKPEKMIIEVREVHIPVPQRKIKKRELFTFLDEEEVENE